MTIYESDRTLFEAMGYSRRVTPARTPEEISLSRTVVESAFAYIRHHGLKDPETEFALLAFRRGMDRLKKAPSSPTWRQYCMQLETIVDQIVKTE